MNILPATNFSKATSYPVFQEMDQEARKWVALFQKKEGKFLTETLQYIYHPDSGSHLYGIHRTAQMAQNVGATLQRYEEIKSHLLSNMKLSSSTSIVEIVGDSGAYSLPGTRKAKEFLAAHLPKSAVWVYGYTGHDEPDGTQCVNAALSSVAEEQNHLHLTLGNLVGFHTPAALEGWGCTGPQLKNYILVYGDDETSRQTGTVFGDDIVTSDFLSDSLLLVEGGIQSFRQACHFLMLGRPIMAIQGLRGDKTRYGILPDNTKKEYFSAAHFLQYLQEKKEQGTVSDERLDSWYRDYLESYLIADPKRQDFDTKQKLLDEAWKIFKEENLMDRLGLFKVQHSS